MALIKCPECGKEISDSAPTCPNCGKPIIEEIKQKKNKKTKIGCLTLVGIVILIIILVSIFGKEEKKEIVLTPQQQKLQDKFGVKPVNSSWDGSVRCVKEYLQMAAKDPDSLKFDDWSKVSYNEKDGWLVRVTYRAKNSFGDYVKETNWFVMRHGRVVAMKPYNAYK